MTSRSRTQKSERQYIVRKIHGRRIEKGVEQFLVQWKQYPALNQWTWEPKESIQHTDVFREFEEEIETSPQMGEGADEAQTPSIISIVGNKRKRASGRHLVRKRRKAVTREQLSEKERWQILCDQRFKCNLCTVVMKDTYFEIDHIHPLEHGGENERSNYQALCSVCHNYKSSILDRTIILQLVQAKGKPTKKEIIRECQVWYMMRNRSRPPHTDPEMVSWAVSIKDMIDHLVKEKVKEIIKERPRPQIVRRMTSEQESDSSIQMISQRAVASTGSIDPPSPPELTEQELNESKDDGDCSPVSRIALMIEQMDLLGMGSTSIQKADFTLSIRVFNDQQHEGLESVKFRKQLNAFFKECYSTRKERLVTERVIHNVRLIFEWKGRPSYVV